MDLESRPSIVEDEKGKIRWDEIPADIYEQEILSYLPVNNLQTLKVVCKDWLRLISSSYFVRLHLSRANRSRIRVLVSVASAFVEYNNYNEEIKQKKIPYPPNISGWETMILGSTDGLICLLDKNKEEIETFILFNPSTREYFGVQGSPNLGLNSCFWFGKRVDGEYILVMGTLFRENRCPGRWEFGVYKFTSSNLKRIHSISIDMQIQNHFTCHGSGVLAHGAIHWAGDLCVNYQWRYTIMAYHPDENEYWKISPPRQCEFRLGVNGDGCLFAIQKKINMQSVFEVWVMKERYWTKHANLEGLYHVKRNKSVPLYPPFYPLGLSPSGDVIFKVDTKLITYSFKDKKVEVLKQYDFVGHRTIMCADTLVSPTIRD